MGGGVSRYLSFPQNCFFFSRTIYCVDIYILELVACTVVVSWLQTKLSPPITGTVSYKEAPLGKEKYSG